MGIKFTSSKPVLASIQWYIIQNYSTKDVDILKVNWEQVVNYVHNTLDEGVARNGDEYEPDYEQWGEIASGR